MTVHDVIIIGGGISGSAALHRLARAGADVVLFESAGRLGGVIASHRTDDGALMEHGPTSAQLSAESLWELIEDLGLADRIVRPSEAAANRYIMRGGKLIAAPGGPKEFLRSRLFTRRAKLRALRERFTKPAPADREESIAQFVERRFGRELLDFAVEPLISGIFAGRPEQLAIREAFPRMHAMEQEHGSLIRGAMRAARARRKERRRAEKEGIAEKPRGLFSFDDGLAVLPGAIEARWADRLRLNAAVDRIERAGNRWRVRGGAQVVEARHLVIATDAGAAASLVGELAGAAAEALRRIEYPPVAVVAMQYRRDAVEHPLDGFGMLLPAVEGRRILGAIFSSTLFPGRAPEGTVLVTAFVGGARSAALAGASEEVLLYETHAELRRTLGIGARPIVAEAHVWPHAIPQYNIGHRDVLAALERAEAQLAGLHFAGNYRGGVAIGDCVASAWKLADGLLAELATQRTATAEGRAEDHPEGRPASGPRFDAVHGSATQDALNAGIFDLASQQRSGAMPTAGTAPTDGDEEHTGAAPAHAADDLNEKGSES